MPSGLFCASFTLVDHPCEKCGVAVEDGRPFCPHCRAPQIHVQIAIPEGETTAALNEAAAGLPVPAHLADFGGSAALHPAISDRNVAVRAALKAGLFGILIGMIPVLGLVLTGSLAVYFYRREKGFAPPIGLGAQLGGAAGVVVFAVNALFTIPIIVFHAQQQCIDRLTEAAGKFGINTSTPQFQEGIRGLFTVSGLATSFVIALLLASAGGALAAAIFRPSSRP